MLKWAREIGVGWGLGGRDLGDERYTAKVETNFYMIFTFLLLVIPSAPETKVSSNK